MSESSPSYLAWPMHPGTTIARLEPASRSEILDRERAQASELSYICMKAAGIKTASSQAPHPPLIPGPHNKAQKAARSQTLARARRGAQAEGVWVRGRKGQILLYTERGRGGARFPPPIYTEYLHFYNSY